MSDGGIGRASIQDIFKEQAEWRREKEKQYPADERNLKAVAAFDQLAATVADFTPDFVVEFGYDSHGPYCILSFLLHRALEWVSFSQLRLPDCC